MPSAEGPRRPRRGRGLKLLAFVIAACTAACGSSGSSASGDRPTIIATTSIWADIVDDLTCRGLARVETLIGAGDPHAFEPSLADRADLEQADLVVANGLGLEEGLEDTLEAVAADGPPVLLMADFVDPMGTDPHLWFDPRRIADAVAPLADRLASAAGLDPTEVAACGDRFRVRIEALDEELADLAGQLPADRRALVTSHDSLAYLADRYAFRVVGTVIPGTSTLAEPNPAELAELEEVIRSTGVRAIFIGADTATADATALAGRIDGVEVVPLVTGNLGPTGSDTDTYESFLRSTMTTIVDALG